MLFKSNYKNVKTNQTFFITARVANFSASIAFSGAIYRDNTKTFKRKRCARETNEVIRNV